MDPRDGPDEEMSLSPNLFNARENEDSPEDGRGSPPPRGSGAGGDGSPEPGAAAASGGWRPARSWRFKRPDLTSAFSVGTLAVRSRMSVDYYRRTSEGVEEVDLHRACRKCPSLTVLRGLFRDAVKAESYEGWKVVCTRQDPEGGGRLPLHCIGLNCDLVLNGNETSSARVEAFILEELVFAHPATIIEEDGEGRIPFTEVICEWIQARRAIRKWMSLVGKRLESPKVVSGRNERGGEEVEGNADLPAMVEWSFYILSSIINGPLTLQLGGSGSLASVKAFDGQESFASFDGKSALKNSLRIMYSDMVVEKLASIPHLLQELLLIEDKVARRRIFALSVVRRVLLSRSSFGNGAWLSQMLIKGSTRNDTQKRRSLVPGLNSQDYNEGAIFYLECISSLTPQDCASARSCFIPQSGVRNNAGIGPCEDAGLLRNISTGDVDTFRKSRDELFSAVGNLEGLISNMIMLDDELFARAAATAVVQRALDEIMLLPLATNVAFFDFITHILIIVAFRSGPVQALFHMAGANVAFHPHMYILWWLVLLTCCMHFVFWEVCAAVAKWFISPKLFWADLMSVWSIVDNLSLFTMLSVSIAIDRYLRDPPQTTNEEDRNIFLLRIRVALATGALWLKFLGRIKMLNMHLATFIFCMFEIMKDIKWFLIVLAITIVAFAQMFASMIHGNNSDQPELGSLDIYFRAYTAMLGDTAIFSSRSLPIFYILYTFIVTVVLLNVLIAIVSSSYDKSMVSSKILFGRARVLFVADLMCMSTVEQLSEKGKLPRWFQNHLFHLVVSLGGVCTKMIVDSVKAKAHLNNTTKLCLGGAVDAWLYVKVAAVFILFASAWYLSLQVLLASCDHSIASRYRKSPTTLSSRCIMRTYSLLIHTFVSKYVFFSEERRAEPLELETSRTATNTNLDQENIPGLDHAMASVRKQVKTETKKSTQQLRAALEDTKEHVNDKCSDLEVRLEGLLSMTEDRIASMVMASEERIMRAVTQMLERRNQIQNGFRHSIG